MTIRSVTLEASHAYCRSQAQRHARSFYFASFALPAEKKRAAFAVYAFCRYVDDLVDRSASKTDAAAALKRVESNLDRMMSGVCRDLPFAPAFAWTVSRFGVGRQPCFELLQGVEMDLGPMRIADWPQLRHYCYHVASVVGLLMARIFELRDEHGLEHAVNLGIAMQLTNILRDVDEDFQMGRIYLPANEMMAAGVTEDDLTARRATPQFKSLVRTQIARAREFYRRAEAGIPMLADDGSQTTVWLMRHIYAGILEEIERYDCDVFVRRVKTSFLRKLVLAVRAWRDYRRTRSTFPR